MDGIDYRVVARNPASASENRIHADDVAQRYGFQGGLVPGVTVYGYACHALVQALGPGWVERGRRPRPLPGPLLRRRRTGRDGPIGIAADRLRSKSPPGKGRAWWARPPSPATGPARSRLPDHPCGSGPGTGRPAGAR